MAPQEATLAELAQRFDVHPHHIGQWREQLTRVAADVFADGRTADPPLGVKTLHAKTGGLTLEDGFVDRARTKAGWLSAE